MQEPQVTPDAADLQRLFAPLGAPASYTPAACERIVDDIAAIERLKRERDAVILAHNYQRPEIFQVADFVGDSLELAQKATTVDSRVIVFCGVHFMAETAKILNPARTVLLPDLRAGCSLADSIDADSLEERKADLRKLYPDLQVVCYVNTSAAVKAASDVCCTSANAARIVERLPTDNVLFVPDQNLARWVQESTKKNVIAWDGNCYVHHQITPEQIQKVRDHLPRVKILAHPECRKDVLDLADAVLSTSGMVRYARESEASEFLVVTECGMSDRLLLEVPDKRFYKSCKLCAYMKMITLGDTRLSLEEMRYPIELDEDVRAGAERSLRRMLELSA
ncbi:MAG TPA: quinolinate synthase NadA [Candidatus Binatia bacterium]|nr:quinolinate synthase NadA [Candidatus Binatia bacterium]